MRFKKKRHHRKSVRFYTACCGFRQPFKVLCDGTFVYNNVVHQITSPNVALTNILGAPVKLFTTRCVLEELRRLGKSYSDSLVAARDLPMARCEHEAKTSAYDCILDIIGENNPEHFFLATQDTDLRRKVNEIPSVPVIFGLRNALFLEQPSSFQRQFVKNLEEQRMHMNETERERLKKRVSKILRCAGSNADEQDDVGEGHEIETSLLKAKRARNDTDVKDKVQFKRKRPKAPNPLSCLKKKKPDNTKSAPLKEKDGDSGSARSRNRKRKRKRSGGGNDKASEAE